MEDRPLSVLRSGAARGYPVAADFARHLTSSLVDDGFDISHSEKLPRPTRCFALGQGLAKAVRAWTEGLRVAFVASGGLSHFTVDPELDAKVMRAFLDCDGDVLGNIPKNRLNSGNSEIRNWITVAGACAGLSPVWRDYIPCYRTPAGTGCGMGFAILWTGS